MAALRAGEYRHRALIQKRTDSQDSYGQPVPAWTTYTSRWAAVDPLSASERFTGIEELAEVNYRIRLRHLPGVRANWRVLIRQPEQTTLGVAITSTSATSATVAAATEFPADFHYLIQIESEVMRVTAGFGTTSWTVARGVYGTTAATHAINTPVYLLAVHEIEGVVHPGNGRTETHLYCRQPGPTWGVADE